MTDQISALGVVLCGGQSRRMDGDDKGLIHYQQKPMVSYAIDALRNCQKTVINANRNQKYYREKFNLPVISDEKVDYSGPLAGMAAAMAYARSQSIDWVMTCPCDAPFISTDYPKKMWQAHLLSPKKLIFIAFDSFRQPVFSLIHTCLYQKLNHFLESDQHKIIIFYDQIGYQKVYFDNSELFLNINYKKDLL